MYAALFRSARALNSGPIGGFETTSRKAKEQFQVSSFRFQETGKNHPHWNLKLET
jgi:hypothetical protein